jgi:chromosome segregation ATPase
MRTMSDSEFVAALRAERADLVPLTEPADLPAALERQRIAHEEYRAVVESRDRIRGSVTQQEHELNAAATEANQVVADLELSQERARARIAEIDRLLTAAADAARARKDLAKANAGIDDARSRQTQLVEIAAALEGEIAELVQKRANAVEQHGRDDLAQRLAGKTAPPPKTLAAIDIDLESRRAALAAALSAKAEIDGPLTLLIEEAGGARNRLRCALQRATELSYYELLPTVLPVVARLMALRSPICGYASLEIHCDDEVLGAANAALEKELHA